MPIPASARARPRGLDRDELQERIRLHRPGDPAFRRGQAPGEGPDEGGRSAYRPFRPEPEDQLIHPGGSVDQGTEAHVDNTPPGFDDRPPAPVPPSAPALPQPAPPLAPAPPSVLTPFAWPAAQPPAEPAAEPPGTPAVPAPSSPPEAKPPVVPSLPPPPVAPLPPPPAETIRAEVPAAPEAPEPPPAPAPVFVPPPPIHVAPAPASPPPAPAALSPAPAATHAAGPPPEPPEPAYLERAVAPAPSPTPPDDLYDDFDPYGYRYAPSRDERDRPGGGISALAIGGFVLLGILAIGVGAFIAGIFGGGVAQATPTPTPTISISPSSTPEETPASSGPSASAGASLAPTATPVPLPDDFTARTEPCAEQPVDSPDGCDSSGSIVSGGSVWVWIGWRKGSDADVLGVSILNESGDTVGTGSLALSLVGSNGCGASCNGWGRFRFSGLEPGNYTIRVDRNDEVVAEATFTVTT